MHYVPSTRCWKIKAIRTIFTQVNIHVCSEHTITFLTCHTANIYCSMLFIWLYTLLKREQFLWNPLYLLTQHQILKWKDAKSADLMCLQRQMWASVTLWLILKAGIVHLPAYTVGSSVRVCLCESWSVKSAIDKLHPQTQRAWTQNKLRWKNTCMFTTYRSNQILLSQEKAKWKSGSLESKIEGLNDTFLQMEVHFYSTVFHL